MDSHDPLPSVMHEIVDHIQHLFTADQFHSAVMLVEKAAVAVLTNAARHEYVANALVKQFGLSESIANLLIELALAVIKSQV